MSISCCRCMGIMDIDVVLLLPGPLGRMPAGGRNWEGFGTDPYLQGVAAAETIKGIQSSGVIATAKHFILKYVAVRVIPNAIYRVLADTFQ